LLNAVAIKNHQKLSAQKRLCFAAKNINEIDQLSFLLMIVLIQNVIMLSGIMRNMVILSVVIHNIITLSYVMHAVQLSVVMMIVAGLNVGVTKTWFNCIQRPNLLCLFFH